MNGAEFRLLDLDANSSLAFILLRDPKENGNALDQALLSSLIEQLEAWRSNPKIRAIIMRSSSDIAFSIGMDFAAFTAAKDTKGADAAAQYSSCLDLIYRFPAPVICLLEGPAKAGGVGLLMAADLILANPQASMSLGEALFGLIPANVLPYLHKRISERKANQMVFQPQALDAETLFTWGLVDIPPTPDLYKCLRSVLRLLLRCNPEALRAQKEFSSQDLPFAQEQKMAQEVLTQRINSQEVRDGISAFQDGNLGPWSAKLPSSLADYLL